MVTNNELILERMSAFLERVRHNDEIRRAHVNVYMALLRCWYRQQANPVLISRLDIMQLAKIRSYGLYHESIKGLHALRLIL